MKEKIKAEILEINATMFNLQERKKQLEIYLQGFEESEAKALEVEKTLTEKIQELESKLEGGE